MSIRSSLFWIYQTIRSIEIYHLIFTNKENSRNKQIFCGRKLYALKDDSVMSFNLWRKSQRKICVKFLVIRIERPYIRRTSSVLMNIQIFDCFLRAANLTMDDEYSILVLFVYHKFEEIWLNKTEILNPISQLTIYYPYYNSVFIISIVIALYFERIFWIKKYKK